jgi:hypothetical protein
MSISRIIPDPSGSGGADVSASEDPGDSIEGRATTARIESGSGP